MMVIALEIMIFKGSLPATHFHVVTVALRTEYVPLR
jgi:hypothetical protein